MGVDVDMSATGEFTATIKNIMSPELERFSTVNPLGKLNKDGVKSLLNQQIRSLSKTIDGTLYTLDITNGTFAVDKKETTTFTTKEELINAISNFCRGIDADSESIEITTNKGSFLCQKDNRTVFVGGDINAQYNPTKHGMYNEMSNQLAVPDQLVKADDQSNKMPSTSPTPESAQKMLVKNTTEMSMPQ